MAAEEGKSVIFLTGAPQAASLTWNESILRTAFEYRIRRYLDSEDQDESTLNTQPASYPLAKWRRVPLSDNDAEVRRNYPSDTISQPETPAQFLSFRDSDGGPEYLDFLEHSLAVALDSLQSPQVEDMREDTVYNDTTFNSEQSFNTTSLSTEVSTDASLSSIENVSGNVDDRQMMNFNGMFTDLNRIPTALHVERIHPQTMTINIIAGIIAVQPARTVRLRRRAGQMDIIEVLVGDETRAGFNVSFWFPPQGSQQIHHPQQSRNSLCATLISLRAGDVILGTNIALGTFKGNVYGQSLHRRLTQHNTSVTVLTQNVTGLSLQSVAKVTRVREWSDRFVGTTAGKRRAASPLDSRLRTRPLLPPDTQPN